MTGSPTCKGVQQRAKASCACGCQQAPLRRGTALYKTFNQFEPTRTLRVKHARIMPPVVVELGRLAGLMYRSRKGPLGRLRTYIHLMEDQPRLVSNVEGTQLYIVGGRYRVSARGIEG